MYKNYEELSIGNIEYDAADKEKNTRMMLAYMLDRVRRMFKWENLPDTVSERALELYLLRGGHCCFTNDTPDGNFYVFKGNLGGEPDVYYMPTKYIVANPYLHYSKTLDIDKNCIVIPNDTLYLGVSRIINKYCTMLAENELTMNIIDVMSRSALIFGVEDQNTNRTAQEYLDNLKKGKIGVVTSDTLAEDKMVNVQPGATASAQVMTHIIELQQYIKASMWNEMGLSANWNAKRETLTSSEILLNTDMLLPLIDDMLFMRQEACEKINKMYGLDISVHYDSAWEDNMEELEAQQEEMKNAAEGMEGNNTKEDNENNPEEAEGKEDEDGDKK